MSTFGELLLQELSESKERLLKLTHGRFEPTQINEEVSCVGARIELFLKSVALPGRSFGENFVWYIDQLASMSVSACAIGRLHALRLAYNKAKHEPTSKMGLLEAVELIEQVRESAGEIVAKGIGNVGGMVKPHTHRVYWIVVWDHYATVQATRNPTYYVSYFWSALSRAG